MPRTLTTAQLCRVSGHELMRSDQPDELGFLNFRRQRQVSPLVSGLTPDSQGAVVRLSRSASVIRTTTACLWSIQTCFRRQRLGLSST